MDGTAAAGGGAMVWVGRQRRDDTRVAADTDGSSGVPRKDRAEVVDAAVNARRAIAETVVDETNSSACCIFFAVGPKSAHAWCLPDS